MSTLGTECSFLYKRYMSWIVAFKDSVVTGSGYEEEPEKWSKINVRIKVFNHWSKVQYYIHTSLLRDCGIDYSIRGTYLFKLGETFMAGKKVVTSKSLGHFANSKSGTTSLKQKTRQSF